MTVTIDFSQASASIGALVERLEDPIPFYDFVGAYELASIRKRIMETKETPEGAAWASWAPMTAMLRREKGTDTQGILWDTGELLHSIHVEVDGTIEMSIVTDAWYAQDLQDGIAGKMPERAFMGWSLNDLNVISVSFLQYVETGFLGAPT